MNDVGTAAIATVMALLIGIGVAAMHRPARAHEPYSEWKQPDSPTVSCCNGDDCRPTRAWLGDDGRWRAWDGLGWIIIPPSKLLPVDHAKDGRSHLCEKEGRIYCFTAGQPRT